MKRIRFAILAVAAAATVESAHLFSKASETKWSVTANGRPAGTITLFSDSARARAEYKSSPSAPTVVYIAANGKIWLKSAGGDVELAATTSSSVDRIIAPALLLPVTVSAKDRVTPKSGAVTSYEYTPGAPARASYKHDASGAVSVEITSGKQTFSLTRTSHAAKAAAAAMFEVRPRAGATTRMSRLAGDLFGPSDSSVSATAGTRGVERGDEFADGGDHAALAALEARDARWKSSLDEALEEFQKDGRIGPARGDQ